MEVLIVGAGAMGRWFGEVVEAAVAFTDVDFHAAEGAVEAVGGRAVPFETDERFDLICIAVPIPEVKGSIADHARRAQEAIADLSGVMTGPVAAMAEHAPTLERLSLHPLFAPPNAPGRIAVVLDNPGSVTASLLDSLESAGYTLFETSPAEHDRTMETVQARAHTAVLAFALSAEEVPEGLGTPIFEGLDQLVEEVVGGTPRVYADIQETFSGAEDVAEAARRLAEADRETFERLYNEARR